MWKSRSLRFMMKNCDVAGGVEMRVDSWRYDFDEDEKQALRVRVNQLKSEYTGDEITRIVCSELDNSGMRSEQHFRLLDMVLREVM